MNTEQHDNTNLGIAIGVLLCGALILAFPKITHMSVVWLAWVFYSIGLIIMCLGIIATCMEVARRW